jgi:hypothetical protein
MKKLTTTAIIILTAIAANAQDVNENNFEPFKNREFIFEVFHIGTTIFAIYLIASFIQTLIKRSLDQRIKNRILDKGTEENIIGKILQPDRKDDRKMILQWVCVLASIGFGLTVITFFRPYGIHTIAIMAFSTAAGFLAYYLITKQSDKQ